MSVLSLVPSLFLAFFVTLLFIAALRPLARSIKLVDMPGGRKRHVGEVPVVGGVAMFLGFIVAWSVLPAPYPTPLHLGLAGVLLVTIGALDDRYTMPPSVRFLTQTSVVLIMVYGAGIRMIDIGDPFGFGVINLGPLSLVITALITVTVINAFNMMDGIDGLAGTMALIAMISIALVAGYQNPMAGIALIAAASVIAFLMTNFPTIYNRRARTFMGDAGSMFIGFVVVWVTMRALHSIRASVTQRAFAVQAGAGSFSPHLDALRYGRSIDPRRTDRAATDLRHYRADRTFRGCGGRGHVHGLVCARYFAALGNRQGGSPVPSGSAPQAPRRRAHRGRAKLNRIPMRICICCLYNPAHSKTLHGFPAVCD
jgi:UDP-GlcNAc:undecaprenyl-phosphate GlcNAc-1-phosphate transferase